MKLTILLLALATAAFAEAEKVRYDFHELHRLVPKTQEQLHALRQFQLAHKFSFWLEPSRVGRPVDILVPPNKKPIFEHFVKLTGIDDKLQNDNVQKLMDEEEQRLAFRSTKALEWSDYHSLEEIYDWLDALEAQYENVNVVVAGTTYENREIRGITITNGDDLPGVVIESGIHAREWIGPAATTWMINEILNDLSDPIWSKFNYLYVPNVNADGYAYTWSTDRMWRKTRSPWRVQGETCYGVDPNRNYNHHRMEAGASSDPCDETFAGPEPFSEIETQTFSEYLKQISETQKYPVYVAYHSYQQCLVFPWGYTTDPAPGEELWQKIGDAAADALYQVHGKEFDVGSIFDVIYPSSGGSDEWFYENLNATLVYSYEMRDTGRYGFLLPPDQIIPVGEEQLASLKAILEGYLNI